ncbi:MAG: tetratricopeptide repeat protein, partial [Gammaproteobacteria bacterium]
MLLTRARTLANAGKSEEAAATLERAIRIEPRNPWLWHRLAVLRLQEGQHSVAIELAKKSNVLARGNRR